MKFDKAAWFKMAGVINKNDTDFRVSIMLTFMRMDYYYETPKDFVQCWSGLLLVQFIGYVLTVIMLVGQSDALIWDLASTMHKSWFHMFVFIVWTTLSLAVIAAYVYTIIVGQRLYVKLLPTAP